jgi:hypothetical protein
MMPVALLIILAALGLFRGFFEARMNRRGGAAMTHGPKLILAIALMAAATALTRFLPFWVFGRGRKPPAAIEYLGRALPPAMLSLLVVYCLKGMDFRLRPLGFAKSWPAPW